MLRNIIAIDKDTCNGCGLCISACHEGALQLVDGKAELLGDSYCDGLGACLPECPTGAITIMEREAAVFDEELVKRHLEAKKQTPTFPPVGGCPGKNARLISREDSGRQPAGGAALQSQLRQWPCQIRLVPVNAPYFDNARLLIAADCTAFAYANIHNEFMHGKITIIGCPKLDDVNYADKLTAIFAANQLKDITVLRMSVPCCGGLVNAVQQAVSNSGKSIAWQVVTIGIDGEVVEKTQML